MKQYRVTTIGGQVKPYPITINVHREQHSNIISLH